MNYIQLVFISFLFVLTAHSQNPNNGVYIGLPNKNVIINDLVPYYDRGYYMENSYYTTGSANSWNVKTDVNQQILWNNFVIHNGGHTTIYSVITDTMGNRFVGGGLFTSSTSAIPMAVKFNACGEQEWCILLPIQGYSAGVICDLAINTDGEIIVLINYLTYSGNQGTSDIVFLAALSPEGDFLWRQVYASPSAYPLLQHPSCFNMTYHNRGYYLSGNCYYADPHNPTHFYLTPFFVGIDSQFQEKWILPFGMEESIRGMAWNVIPLNDNYLMGIVDHWLPGIEKRTTLAFFDTKGNVKGYNPILNESLSPDYTWNVALTASRVNDSLFASLIGFGAFSQMNFGEVIFDTAGNVHNFNVTGQHFTDSRFTKTIDGKFIAGVPVKKNSNFSRIYLYKFDENLQSIPFDTTTYVYDSLCPYPMQSGTIDLTGCMVLTSTDWIPTPQEYYASIRTIPITIYPNPANDNITFALENTEHHRNIEIRCFNLLGVLHHQTKVQRGQQQATTNVSNWPPGMYIAVVYSDGKPVGRGKFAVQ